MRACKAVDSPGNTADLSSEVAFERELTSQDRRSSGTRKNTDDIKKADVRMNTSKLNHVKTRAGVLRFSPGKPEALANNRSITIAMSSVRVPTTATRGLIPKAPTI